MNKIQKLALTTVFAFSAMLAFSCSSSNDSDDEYNDNGEGSFTVNKISDYKTVEIGNQTWMAENLNYFVKGSRCYDNKPENCQIYGRLYDWETAKISCPTGWHLPSDEEWEELVDFVGISAGTKLKATSGWEDDGNGTNDYKFAALPGGHGSALSGGHGSDSFYNAGLNGDWWSATEYYYYDSEAYTWYMIYHDEYVGRSYGDKKRGLFSVRCIKD